MEYATPEVLVDTEWVATHTPDENIRVVEVDYDPENAYRKGHIPGAVLMRWKSDINDTQSRNILSLEQFESLMSRNGISPDTCIVLYGDFNNWFATFAFWVFKIYGHKDARIMNGGRKKWELEGRSYDTKESQEPDTKYLKLRMGHVGGTYHAEEPRVHTTQYKAAGHAPELRAFRSDVANMLGKDSARLVDVRSPPEFRGEIAAPGEYSSEGAQRAGHIPGAANIPWLKAVNDEDGTFKSAADLRKLYESAGITPDKDVVAYCRIGERSSHTWFVLKYLLGYPSVVNYDGSWSEWGNSVGAPVER